MRCYVIFNPKSGTALKLGLSHETLAEHFQRHGLDVEIDSKDDGLEQKIERARQSDCNTVICAGGDGTFTSLARGLAGSGKSMALLPLGTANLLARDLRIPLSLEASIAAIGAMQVVEIDAAEVNGRLFLHKVVVGVIPAIAAAREKVRGGNIIALARFARYFVRRLADARKTAVAITSRDTDDRVERVHAIAVANNTYDEGWGKIFSRRSLNAGSMTLYILKRLTPGDALRLAVEMVMGRWQQDGTVSIETVRSVTLRTKHARVAAMIDGEVELLETPLQFRIRPRFLRVLAPVVEVAADEGGIDAASAPV